MKLFKVHWLYLLMVAFFVLPSCDDDDDDDLVGDWKYYDDFDAVPRVEAVVFVIGEDAYIGTGYDTDNQKDLKDFFRFSPEKGNRYKKVASLPAEADARHGAVAFSAGGKGYVGTGYNSDKDKDKYYNDFYEFDPSVGDTGEWKRIADFKGDARSGAVAFSINGIGYVGTGDSDRRRKDFFKYDPSTDTWTEIAPILGNLRQDAAAFVINNKGYVVTGVNNEFVTDVDVYDPETGVWTELRRITSDTNDDESYDDDYNIVCSNSVAFTMNGYGYIATGGRGVAGNKTWEYDPSTDLWDEKTEFEGSSRLGAVGFSINDQGYVGLGSSASRDGIDYSDAWILYPNAEQDDNNNGN